MADTLIIGGVGCSGRGKRGKRGRDGSSNLIAGAVVASDGGVVSSNNRGFATIAKVTADVGVYEFTLTAPPANLSNLAVMITLNDPLNPFCSPVYEVSDLGVITVAIGSDMTNHDRGFAIVVFDLT